MTKPKHTPKPKTKAEQDADGTFNLSEPPLELPPIPPPPPPAPKKEEVVQEPLKNKSEAIRRALAAGIDKPLDGVVWIKEKFGLDVNAQTFSAIKGQVKGKPKAAVKHTLPARRSLPSAPTSGSYSGIELAKDVKRLIDEHGAEAVGEALALFAD